MSRIPNMNATIGIETDGDLDHRGARLLVNARGVENIPATRGDLRRLFRAETPAISLGTMILQSRNENESVTDEDGKQTPLETGLVGNDITNNLWGEFTRSDVRNRNKH